MTPKGTAVPMRDGLPATDVIAASIHVDGDGSDVTAEPFDGGLMLRLGWAATIAMDPVTALAAYDALGAALDQQMIADVDGPTVSALCPCGWGSSGDQAWIHATRQTHADHCDQFSATTANGGLHGLSNVPTGPPVVVRPVGADPSHVDGDRPARRSPR